MANRYWVGGSGTWNTTSTTNWSASSGGASGASVPTAADSVFFDQAGTYTVTCTGALTCLDITVSAGTVTFADGTSPTFAISGSMSLIAGTVWSSTGAITFNATSTGKTITTNGASFASNITFNGVGGGWTLGSAITTSVRLVFTAGTFSTSASNYATTSDRYIVQGGTVNLNGSTVTLTGTSTINPFQYLSGTFNAGTSQINCTGATNTGTFGGGATFYNVSFTSVTATPTISGANTFNNLSFTGATGAGVNNVTFSANQTINGTLTVPAGTNATMRTFVQSDTIGTTRTLTCAAFSATDTDFRDITIAGAAAPASGTRLGDCKGNSGITFGAGVNKYWNLAAGGNWSATGWATTGGGTPAVNNFPLAQDTAIFQSTGLNSGATVTITTDWNIGTIDMSARTSNTMTLATSTNTPTIYGNWINGTGTTLTGSGAMVFAGRGSQTITSAGVTFTQGLTLNSPSGTLTLQDAFITSRVAVGAIALANGTFDLNGKTATISSSATSSFRTDAGTKNLTFNGGTLILAPATSQAFNNLNPTGFTTTAGTGTGTISMTAATAKTFVGGGSTFNCVLNQGGAGALTISGSNTFNNITNTYGSTGATTITFTNATTTTVAAFTAAGTAGKLLTLNSSTAGSQATITLTGGGTVSTNYLSVQDIAFTPAPATDGTTPYVWYLGANSTNSGNNTGGLFQAGGTGAIKVYQITNTVTTTWTVPSDWNSSSNTIHLIGGGGGGAASAVSGNNRSAGGGGGGGGYRAITNYSTTPSSSITVAVGAGGTAGAVGGGLGSTGGTGGTTSWAVTNTATGGSGGSSTTTPTSTGGAGGAGTFAGGQGGAGAFGTVASTGYGGGGAGGAGGPNGIGGAGGTGFGSTTAGNIAGGGGGGNGGGSAGGNAASATAGTGGNNFGGTGGGATSGTDGTFGGGGAGRVGAGLPGNGGSGIDILNTIGGAGGKGGGSSGASSANTGLYGGGGSGAGMTTAGAAAAGGAGSQGIIIIAYTPSAVVTNTSNFFQFFPM
jgi:hypothetical protein